MTDLPPDAFLRASQFTRVVHRDIYPAIDPTLPPLANSQAGRTIVITGASAGLGHLAYARSFATAGAKTLVLGARSVGKLEQVKKDLVRQFPTLDVVVGELDVGDPKSQEAFWKVVKEKEGKADVLISNAGTDPGPWTVKEIDQGVFWQNMVSEEDARLSFGSRKWRRSLMRIELMNCRKPTSEDTSSPASTSFACSHLRRSLPTPLLPLPRRQNTVPLSSTRTQALSAALQCPSATQPMPSPSSLPCNSAPT